LFLYKSSLARFQLISLELVYKVLLKPFMVPDSIMVGLYGLLLLCYIQGS